MSDKLTKHADNIKEKREQETQRAMESIKDSITTDTTLRSMPKEIFYSVFYPYFIGEKNIKDDDTIISKWVSFAGNVRRGVNLTDENGMTIGTVPGIVGQTPASFVQNLGVNFTKFGSEYELLQKRSSEKSNLKATEMIEHVIEEAKKIEPDMDAFEKILIKGDDYDPNIDMANPYIRDDIGDYIIYD